MVVITTPPGIVSGTTNNIASILPAPDASYWWSVSNGTITVRLQQHDRPLDRRQRRHGDPLREHVQFSVVRCHHLHHRRH